MNHQVKSMVVTLLLILLGTAALYGGPNWLTILIPGAALVWFAAGRRLRRSRN